MNEALSDSIDRLEYEHEIPKDIEDCRIGALETVTLDEVGESLELKD